MVDSQVEPSLRTDRDLVVKIVLRAINSAIDELKSRHPLSPIISGGHYRSVMNAE